MRILKNLIWLLLVGIPYSVYLFVFGVIFCITIIGIPLGLKSFSLIKWIILPMEASVEMNIEKHPVLNVLWAAIAGAWLSIELILYGIIFCVTIIGIPLGISAFRLVKPTFFPFGAEFEEW